MRDYGKVHTAAWSSKTIKALSDDGKLLAFYLMTSPHSTIAGVFRLPDGYVCEDTGWTPERVSKAFQELLTERFANRCEESKWVWVINHLEWNPPENPNQRKSASKVAQSVPDECSWKQEFMRVCGPSLGISPPQSANPSLTVVQPFANQEQEQEQEQEQDEEPSASSSAKLPPCPHRKVLELFGKHLPMLPQPKPELWSGQRAKHLAARWKWLLTATKKNHERYATTEDEALQWLDRFFGYVAQSEFLTGRDSKWSGCDLGWLCNEENFAKVVQGNYHREAA
jgi:hypothetical protein